MTKPKPDDAQRIYPDIDDLLDHEIETRIRAGVWKQRDKLSYAQHVLDVRALKRAKNAQAEQTELARSAKNGAWVAAIFAGISAIAAIIAAAAAVIEALQ